MENDILWTASDDEVNAEFVREDDTGMWVINLDGTGARGYPTIGLTREDIKRLRDAINKELAV